VKNSFSLGTEYFGDSAMGQTETQTKYLTKVVLFNGQKMTLFSLDGNTWSTRKVELSEIKKRHELQRAELAGIKEEGETAQPTAPSARRDEEDLDLDREFDADSGIKDVEAEELPFVVPEDEQQDKRYQGRAKLRAKAGSGKLPVKPVPSAFKSKKPSVKIVDSKKLEKKLSPVPAKKVKPTKSPAVKAKAKPAKSTAPKKRKAA
jgi:hypothetical protein